MLSSARLTLKQYRFEAAAAALAAVLLGFAALIVTYRLSSIAMPAGCFEAWLAGPGGDFSPDCESATDLWSSINANESNFVFGAMLILPFLVGLIGGIPIVARELEGGTAQTAWSVTPSRIRWLRRQLLPVLALLGIATAFAAAATAILESTQPGSAVEHLILQGPPVVARALAAFGIGVLVGSVIGRSLPAFLIGMVLCVVLAFVAEPIRFGWLHDRKVPVGQMVASGYSFGFVWRTPDGTLVPLGQGDDFIYELVPPEHMQQTDDPDSGPEAWLLEHGYEMLQLGVPDEVARGWIPIEVAGMSLIGLGAIGAAAIAVNRRRPT
jgi:hypothetical protein